MTLSLRAIHSLKPLKGLETDERSATGSSAACLMHTYFEVRVIGVRNPSCGEYKSQTLSRGHWHGSVVH